MQTVQYRRWAPPESSLRIEFSPELLQEVRRTTTGMLYGSRHGDEVRVMSTVSDANFEILGTFANRVRGDVFMTESDLLHFDHANAVVALVLVGKRAGFFVKNSDGSIQSIQSYEEFSIGDAISPPAIARKKIAPPPKARWTLAMTACLALIAIPLAAAPFWKPLLVRPRLALSVIEVAGQLRITWNPRAIRGPATIEIMDGTDSIVRPVTPVQTSVVYAPRTAKVEVRLSEFDGGANAVKMERADFDRTLPTRHR
jgi:hypothetical protein